VVWCDIALEVEAIICGDSRREYVREWLLSCLAAFAQLENESTIMHAAARGESVPNARVYRRVVKQIETCLKSRQYVAGNPLLGLPLRNGFVYSDARLVGRIALRLSLGHQHNTEALDKLRAFAQRERLSLVTALCSLVTRGETLPVAARRIAGSQLQGTGLPKDQIKSLRRMLHQPPSIDDIVGLVESQRAAHYLVEQLLLAAEIDGHVDEKEWAFINEIGGKLASPAAQLIRIERRVRLFCAYHRDLFDLFTDTQYYGQLEAVLRERVTRIVQRNLDALVQEIRQTGELATLLGKAAAGHKLSTEERTLVREQLLDIVRALPSLALFSLPGGALLLPLVLRVLPWDLRPTAFRDQDRK
jgi:hypothetical protein